MMADGYPANVELNVAFSNIVMLQDNKCKK